MESKLGREIFKLNESIAIQGMANTMLLDALLRVFDRPDLDRVKSILEHLSLADESP